MYWLLINGYSYWIVLLLAIVNAGFMARVFIIFHDCTHNAYFKTLDEIKISVSLRTGFRSLYFRLYDEETKKLVSFKRAEELVKSRKL